MSKTSPKTPDLFGHSTATDIYTDNGVYCFDQGGRTFMRCKDIAARKFEKDEDVSAAHKMFRKGVPEADLVLRAKNVPVHMRGFYFDKKHLPAFVDLLNDDVQMEAVVQRNIAFAMQQQAKTIIKRISVTGPAEIRVMPDLFETPKGEWLTYKELAARTNKTVPNAQWHVRDKGWPRRRRLDGASECFITEENMNYLLTVKPRGAGMIKRAISGNDMAVATFKIPTFLARLINKLRSMISQMQSAFACL